MTALPTEAQLEFDVRFEWGESGIRALAPVCDTLIIVDVLSFTTAVDVAVARGASVLPFPFYDARAEDFARTSDALLAVPRRQVSAERPYSLSPPSLSSIPSGTRLVLPSPNGSTLTVAALECARGAVIAGCLRNGSAVAEAASLRPGPIGVVASGERWPDASLRPALEDLLGAGAIISRIRREKRSPEAVLAAAAFAAARTDLQSLLHTCVSGRELREAGFPQDVASAAELDVSRAVPTLLDGAYQDGAPPVPRSTAPD